MRTVSILTILITFLIFSFSFSGVSYSQGQRAYGEFASKETKKTEQKLLKSARNEFENGNYKVATEKYTELLKIDSTNPLYNFEQAQTLYNNYRQPQSIPYYEKAIKYSKDTIGEAYFFLANAYHLAGNFDMAAKNYKTYLDILNIFGTDLMEDEESDLKADVKHRIEMCTNGNILSKTPVTNLALKGKSHSFQVVPVGKDVNSDFDDYDAVLSATDSIMYFTSRREGATGGKLDWDDKFFEDIYASSLSRKGWGGSFNIGPPINTKKHEAIIAITPDGKTIYFYKGVKQGTFYFSNLNGNAWTKPEVLYEKSDMNTSAWETSFFGFTLAGGELYVVSDREGGIGGRDIYVSKKQSDGAWGPMTNMGTPVNSPYDEDAPFLTEDGKTMYFSSKGHNSMGGFDIFKSERNGDKWSEPVNLGVPINTPGDDVYFLIAHNSDKAFYSSSSHSADSTKDMDIFSIDLCDDIPETVISGLAMGIKSGTISVEEKPGGNQVASFEIKDGRYSVRLQHGKNYKFILNTAGIEPATAEISVPKLCKVYDIYQELSFTQPGQPLVYKNAFFDIKTEAGKENYSDYLSKSDKSTLTNYSEVSVMTTPIVVATATTVPTATTVATGTTTTTASTTTTTASTHTTSATTTTTTTASTQTTAATATTTTTASTHTTSATTTTTTTASTHTTAVTPTTTATASTHTTTTTTTSTTGSTTTTTISINNILFDYDKSEIKAEFKSELDKAVEFLKNTNKKAKIEVVGYTDSKGSDEYNLALSKRRANAVANYLATKGISRSRIKTVGYGETKPIASNENPDGSDNPDGRAKNRRTEIVVIQ